MSAIYHEALDKYNTVPAVVTLLSFMMNCFSAQKNVNHIYPSHGNALCYR